METQRVIVIGTSAGGMQPLLELAAGLPADFPAAVCIVMHIPAYIPSFLPNILGRAGPLSAVHPANGDPILPGRIYCAPPDQHLLIENGRFNLTRGPKENRMRPAVDTLFRSAAYSAGSNVIGVVLSGLLDDGTSGLWAIKQFGGTTVVQDPRDAQFDSMPASALNQVQIDHVVTARHLAALLVQLVAEPVQAPREAGMNEQVRKRLITEISIASGGHAFKKGVMTFGKVTPQTCPECGGVLVQIQEGGFTRYRCHTGHAYTGDTLLVSVTEAIEDKLWATLRALEEASMLLENTGQEFEAAGNARLAGEYRRRAKEMEARSAFIFENVARNRSLSVEQLEYEASQKESPQSD